MSKSKILAIKNINLFTNENAEIQFSLSREQKVTAQYSAYDKEKAYDLRGIRAKSKAGKGYIRLVLSLSGAEKREYFQGALFKNEKKEGAKSPDFRGSVTVNEDVKVALAAWIKTGDKAGQYLSIAISEFRSETAPATSAPKSQSRDPFDMNDEPAPLPAARPAKAPAPASKPPAQATQSARHSYSDDDYEIPF